MEGVRPPVSAATEDHGAEGGLLSAHMAMLCSLSPALPSALQGLRPWPTCLSQLAPVPEEVRPYFRGSFSLKREKIGSQRIGGDDLSTFLVFLFLTPQRPLPHTSGPTVEGQKHSRKHLEFTAVELETRSFTPSSSRRLPPSTGGVRCQAKFSSSLGPKELIGNCCLLAKPHQARPGQMASELAFPVLTEVQAHFM